MNAHALVVAVKGSGAPSVKRKCPRLAGMVKRTKTGNKKKKAEAVVEQVVATCEHWERAADLCCDNCNVDKCGVL